MKLSVRMALIAAVASSMILSPAVIAKSVGQMDSSCPLRQSGQVTDKSPMEVAALTNSLLGKKTKSTTGSSVTR